MLDETVYALDATTIDLCLSVFPWARFRTTKGAVKLHTLLDLCGPIPSFIHISDGKLHDVNVLDLLIAEPGAIYVMDRAYVVRIEPSEMRNGNTLILGNPAPWPEDSSHRPWKIFGVEQVRESGVG